MTYSVRNMSTSKVEGGADAYYSAVLLATLLVMRAGVCFTIEFAQSGDVLSRHHPSGEIVAFQHVDKEIAGVYLRADVKGLAKLLGIIPGVNS